MKGWLDNYAQNGENIPKEDLHKKQEYWDTLATKYGEGVKGRQNYIDLYSAVMPGESYDFYDDRNNKFLDDNSYSGYRQLHRNIKRRLQTVNMLKGEGIIKRNGGEINNWLSKYE